MLPSLFVPHQPYGHTPEDAAYCGRLKRHTLSLRRVRIPLPVPAYGEYRSGYRQVKALLFPDERHHLLPPGNHIWPVPDEVAQEGDQPEEQEEEFLVLSNSIDKNKFPYDSEAYGKHLDYCYNQGLYIGYPLGFIKTIDDLYSKNENAYTYYYNKVKENKENENIIKKPRGRYLVGYINDSYINVSILYKRMLNYIKEHNLEVIGYTYEDVLFDLVAVQNLEDYIIKVSINIR